MHRLVSVRCVDAGAFERLQEALLAFLLPPPRQPLERAVTCPCLEYVVPLLPWYVVARDTEGRLAHNSVVSHSAPCSQLRVYIPQVFQRLAPRFDSSWRLTFLLFFLPPVSGEVPDVLCLGLHVYIIFSSGVWVHDDAAVCCAALFGTSSRDILV